MGWRRAVRDCNRSTLFGRKVGDTAWRQIVPVLTEDLTNLSVHQESSDSILQPTAFPR
jgi:hypothetical protein